MNWAHIYGLLVGTALLAADSDKHVDDLSLAKTDVNNPEIYLTVTQVLVKNGYPAETHTVVTEDGYLLAVHHIPQKKTDASKVVVMFRCMYCTGYVYLLLGPNKALGYLIADAGYDVWLVEMRGNTYSSSHVKLNNHQSKFWDFSWHEMGVYDVPAVLDYITTKTGADKVYTIGYSMGTTAMFVAGAMRPEYMSKIRLSIVVAPVAYCSHVSGVPGLIARSVTPEMMRLVPNRPLFRDEVTALLRFLGRPMCSRYLTATLFCRTLFSILGGKDFNNLNTTAMPVVTAHMPDQESIRTFFHYMQGVSSRKFRQYDYGAARNLRVYGSKTPTEYNVSQITAPMALIWSTGDSLADPQDVRKLVARLPNVVFQKEIQDLNFSHFDFNLGNDALKVNTEVMNLLENWSDDTQ